MLAGRYDRGWNDIGKVDICLRNDRRIEWIFERCESSIYFSDQLSLEPGCIDIQIRLIARLGAA